MSTTTNALLSPRDAQTQLHVLLDAVQAIVGGDWVNHDSPSPRGCRLTEESPLGVAFTGRRSLDAPPASTETIGAVLALLSAEGMEAGTRTSASFTTIMGVHPDNKAFYVELEMRARAMTLSGQSACVAGDLVAELDRVKLT